MLNSKDLLARLLANENLNIIRANVRTASFVGQSRTLTLPMWRDMTVEIEEMLIGHEVGHALYTDFKMSEDHRYLHDYMNVVEDVRIEKKVKNKYPGLRKSFLLGYKQLNDKDFFGVRNKDLSQYILIDRINLFYKMGINCGVKFNTKEMELVRKVDSCDTPQDVFNVAKEIYDYSKQELEEMKTKFDEYDTSDEQESDQDQQLIDMSDYDDSEDWEEEYAYDEDETDEKVKSSNVHLSNQSDDSIEDKMKSKTSRSFQKNLEDMAQVDLIVKHYEPKLQSNHPREYIVPFTKIITEIQNEILKMEDGNSYWKEAFNNRMILNLEKIPKFREESNRIVSYLAKEFEMKKSASEYKRTLQGKSGEINVNKLFAHKLTDDLFKKIQILPEDKNHGMIFLLDWSGSMCDVIEDTIKQVINLAMFCRRVQIPFRVFAFTDHYTRERGDYSVDNLDYTKFMDEDVNMFELFSDKMSNSQFTRMMELLFTRPWTYSNKYALGGTPLNPALLFVYEYLEGFIKMNNIEKVSLITLTDGEGSALKVKGSEHVYNRTSVLQSSESKDGKRYRVVNYIQDKTTKREYKVVNNELGVTYTRIIMNLMRDKYPNIKIVGFHIIENRRNCLHSFLDSNCEIESRQFRYNEVERLRKALRQNDYEVIPNTSHDELYLLLSSKQKLIDSSLEISSKMNAKAIAKKFGEFLSVKKTSRVVLNRFISLVA